MDQTYRTVCVARNLIKVLQCKTRILDTLERAFIKRFVEIDEHIYYNRPVMFGVQQVHCEELTKQEFNRLHRIANVSSIQH